MAGLADSARARADIECTRTYGAVTRKVTDTQARLFAPVRALGLTFPDVEAAIRYDGAPVLKARGCFMASLATHASAEPGSLVVRMSLDERAWLLEEAPETYYLTDYYRSYPVVLVRLSMVGQDALRDLLSVSWRLTVAKASRSRRKRLQGFRSPPFKAQEDL